MDFVAKFLLSIGGTVLWGVLPVKNENSVCPEHVPQHWTRPVSFWNSSLFAPVTAGSRERLDGQRSREPGSFLSTCKRETPDAHSSSSGYCPSAGRRWLACGQCWHTLW